MGALHFIAAFVSQILNLLTFAIIARALLSWFSQGRSHSLGRLEEVLYEITEPILMVIRRFPHRFGMIDLSPLIAIFALDFIRYLLGHL
ncbi:MAG: YggT family protein [Patescibacteria group bacterium]